VSHLTCLIFRHRWVYGVEAWGDGLRYGYFRDCERCQRREWRDNRIPVDVGKGTQVCVGCGSVFEYGNVRPERCPSCETRQSYVHNVWHYAYSHLEHERTDKCLTMGCLRRKRGLDGDD
jgi:hypothetical protein